MALTLNTKGGSVTYLHTPPLKAQSPEGKRKCKRPLPDLPAQPCKPMGLLPSPSAVPLMATVVQPPKFICICLSNGVHQAKIAPLAHIRPRLSYPLSSSQDFPDGPCQAKIALLAHIRPRLSYPLLSTQDFPHGPC
ncbi:hypothetical protein PoB_001011500 [Plakobranchus ocellatus]|uniref:Uncharacterized protein n=1 Tax=Plakobranchus ocellatus TaxID=259542 RepID=A0AAV3YLK9_9GAST|nr:hypothetical protein PoB_001011500 [Plakobranchus ocellatus]